MSDFSQHRDFGDEAREFDPTKPLSPIEKATNELALVDWFVSSGAQIDMPAWNHVRALLAELKTLQQRQNDFRALEEVHERALATLAESERQRRAQAIELEEFRSAYDNVVVCGVCS